MEKLLAVVEAGWRSLDWLASYPGGGAMNAYNQMREALNSIQPEREQK